MTETRPQAAVSLLLSIAERGIDEIPPLTTNEWIDVFACLAYAYSRALPVPDPMRIMEDFATGLEHIGRTAKSEHSRAFAKGLSRKLMAMGH